MSDSEQNHDLDFGVAQFRHLRDQCQFPWLLANVLDPALGEDVPIGNCEKTCMLTSSNGIKVGVIGLGEREWYFGITYSICQWKLTFSFAKARNH
jgi:hypothetical protein